MIRHLKTSILSNYAVFRGRSPRAEYWTFTLFWWVGFVICATINGTAGFLWFLALFLPATGVAIRRLHDVGMSGWHLLWAFVPYLGVFLLVIFALLPSQPHANKFDASVPAPPSPPSPPHVSQPQQPSAGRQSNSIDLNDLRNRLKPR